MAIQEAFHFAVPGSVLDLAAWVAQSGFDLVLDVAGGGVFAAPPAPPHAPRPHTHAERRARATGRIARPARGVKPAPRELAMKMRPWRPAPPRSHMTTHGFISFIANDEAKDSYSHCDSGPYDLGGKVLRWL